MTRWIVAGVLLAVLVALVVLDTSELPGADATPPAAAPGAATVEGAPAAPPSEDVAVVETREAVEAACGAIKAEILAAKGEAFMNQIGEDALKVVTEAQFIAKCKEVEALPLPEKIAKLQALGAGAAPAASPAP